jgi:hypothetical protein
MMQKRDGHAEQEAQKQAKRDVQLRPRPQSLGRLQCTLD